MSRRIDAEGDASASRHLPECDSQLGPEFEVRDGVVYMTITACMGCVVIEVER